MLLLVAIIAAYTNHAGQIISAQPVQLDHRTVVLSNAIESARYPLSIFPVWEQRRIAMDYAASTGEISALRIPDDILKAVNSAERSIKLSRKRVAAGLCSEEASRKFIEITRASLSKYLDAKVSEGRLAPAECALLKKE